MGTYVLSLANLLSYINCIWTVNAYGRRSLLLFGHIGIACAHFCIALSIVYSFNFGVVLMMCAFIWLYANTTGTIAWVYAAETCTDIGMGVCLLTLWAVVLLEIMLVPMLINTPMQVQGVFFLFSVLSVFATFFIYFYVKETKGLTDE